MQSFYPECTVDNYVHHNLAWFYLSSDVTEIEIIYFPCKCRACSADNMNGLWLSLKHLPSLTSYEVFNLPHVVLENQKRNSQHSLFNFSASNIIKRGFLTVLFICNFNATFMTVSNISSAMETCQVNRAIAWYVGSCVTVMINFFDQGMG